MISIDIYSILRSKKHNPHYLNRYYKFILACVESNKDRGSSVYTERHHICPKSKDLFPEYNSLSVHTWNLVVLTAKQHYIAHHLLWKSYSWSSMSYSFKCFVDGYTTKSHERIFLKITANKYKLLKEENAVYNSHGKIGMVNAKDKNTGIFCVVPKEEFYSNDNLVGSATGAKFTNSEETKRKKRKPKSKEHAEKINKKNAIMHKTPFVCCLVTKKIYTSNSWTKHYKLLYEDGYLESLREKAKLALTGLSKKDEHKKALSVAKKLKNSIERVCDINTRKEYDIANYRRWVLNR